MEESDVEGDSSFCVSNWRGLEKVAVFSKKNPGSVLNMLNLRYQ